MKVGLNKNQIKSLSGFFMDVAKGTIVGGLSVATISQTNYKILITLQTMFVTIICVYFGIKLLNEIYD